MSHAIMSLKAETPTGEKEIVRRRLVLFDRTTCLWPQRKPVAATGGEPRHLSKAQLSFLPARLYYSPPQYVQEGTCVSEHL